MKIIVNAIYIMKFNKRQDFKGQNFQNLLLSVFCSPFTLLASLFVDVISLPAFLLKEEFNFEFKYQKKMENFNSDQEKLVMGIFKKVFYKDFENRPVKKMQF